MKWFLLIALGFAQIPAVWAYTPCQAVEWNKGRDLKKRDWVPLLEATPRPLLIQNAFFEMFQSPKNSVLLPLTLYLGNTELDDDLRGFWLLMATIQTRGQKPEQVFKTWPKDRGVKKYPVTQWDICRAYNRALDLAATKSQAK